MEFVEESPKAAWSNPAVCVGLMDCLICLLHSWAEILLHTFQGGTCTVSVMVMETADCSMPWQHGCFEYLQACAVPSGMLGSGLHCPLFPFQACAGHSGLVCPTSQTDAENTPKSPQMRYSGCNSIRQNNFIFYFFLFLSSFWCAQ